MSLLLLGPGSHSLLSSPCIAFAHNIRITSIDDNNNTRLLSSDIPLINPTSLDAKTLVPPPPPPPPLTPPQNSSQH